MSIADAPAGNHLRDAKGPLDAAVYARLSTPAITDLESKVVVVGSFFQNDKCFPYVAIGDAESPNSAQWTSKTSGGMEITFAVDLWSQYKGTKELNAIAAQVIDRLTATKLDLSADDFNVARHQLEQDITLRMNDGQTMRRLLRFRVQVQDLITVQPTP